MDKSENLELLALPDDKVAYVYGEDGKKLLLRRIKIYQEDDLISKLKSAKPVFYTEFSTSLATARTAVASAAFDITGDFMAIQALGSVTCHLILNEINNGKILLSNEQTITTPFYRFWLVHAALAGESIELIIGRNKLFKITY